MDSHLIEEGTRLILEGLGCYDADDHNFHETPARVARMYEEMFTAPPTSWAVFEESYTDIVMIRNHNFATLCPHHMLPVKVTAHIAYLPNGTVIGASKLMRMIDEANTRPFTQEKLTALIIEKICELTVGTSCGEAVMLIGRHDCFQIRGVKSHDAEMVTAKFAGNFNDNAEMRQRFFDLVRL